LAGKFLLQVITEMDYTKLDQPKLIELFITKNNKLRHLKSSTGEYDRVADELDAIWNALDVESMHNIKETLKGKK
jgi:hypothetical protein